VLSFFFGFLGALCGARFNSFFVAHKVSDDGLQRCCIASGWVVELVLAHAVEILASFSGVGQNVVQNVFEDCFRIRALSNNVIFDVVRKKISKKYQIHLKLPVPIRLKGTSSDLFHKRIEGRLLFDTDRFHDGSLL
jgi:hypothetical protein